LAYLLVIHVCISLGQTKLPVSSYMLKNVEVANRSGINKKYKLFWIEFNLLMNRS